MMRSAGHIAHMSEMRKAYKNLLGKREAKRPLGRPSRRWRIVLRWMLRKYVWKAWIGLILLRIGNIGCCCERRKQHSIYIKGGEFLAS
jgi:hypothetical protein